MKVLDSLRPRSLSGLVLLALAVVALPLLLGTVSAAVQMRDLAAASERLVLNGVSATRYTQALVRQVASMERAARLYQILQRPALVDSFEQNRRLLGATLDGLQSLPGDPHRGELIEQLRDDCNEIAAALGSGSRRRIDAALRGFPQLSRSAGELSRLAGAQTDRELEQLRVQTERVRRRIYLQASALVPITLALVLLFAGFLGRSIRGIDAAISSIGHGRLDTPIRITGPSDLRTLGRQLEWLRLRLGEVSQERNRFLRHVSHELKTPLANIREGSELLAEGAVGALRPEQREVVGILRENSLRLQRLIENLLSYSEWQSRRGGLELSEFRLLPLVQATLETQHLPLSARHVGVDLSVEDLTLQADRAKLRLIVDNLVSNAVKFTPDGGRIALRARADGERLVFEVADDGPGIAAQDRARIFEAFYQGSTPAGSLVRGTGIGLSVVQEFVHAQGGTVEIVDGEFPGAHLRVTMPLRVGAPLSAAAATGTDADHPDTDRMTADVANG